MDYEKAYKDALERAKSGKPMNEVFPELKESEDEKIRKILIHIVKGACSKYGIKYKGDEITEEKLLAYLERQKEQKPVGWKPRPESLEALMYAIEGKWEMIKPTSYLSRRLEELYEGIVNTFNVNEVYLEELPKVASTGDIEELKALEPSMDEKPAEWSEEDEKRVVELKTFIAKCNGFNKANKQKAFELIDSLRPQPHWKPSGEQIDTLEAVVGMIHPTDTRYDAVFGLLEELKAL